MDWPLTVIAVILDAGALALLIYWLAGLARLIATLRGVPPASDGLNLPTPAQSVCVLVPAHNEARCIGELIRSLRAQDYPRVRFVLCLDRCTDQTEPIAAAAIAGDDRFEIIRVDDCPADWAGKVHAVWTGVTRAKHAAGADVLLFADADTSFHPGCVRGTLAMLERGNLALLSLLSTLTCERWFERAVQPAAGIEMTVQYPLARAGRDSERRAFANGQFMMFRRDAYEAVGGHAAVRDELLEDMALARRIAERGLRAGVFLADGMVCCRMYPDWPSFQRGWKRIYTECSRRRPDRLRRNAWRVGVFGAVLPVSTLAALGVSVVLLARGHALAGGAGIGLSCAALALWAAVVAACYRASGAPLWCVPAYPFGAWGVAAILFRAARDLTQGRGIEWGGRVYAQAPR